MAPLLLLQRLCRVHAAGDARKNAHVAGRAIPCCMLDAVPDAALQHLRNERVQAQGRRHEVLHARVLGCGGGSKPRYVLLPVPSRRQEVGADHHGGGAVTHARVERVCNAGRRLGGVGRDGGKQ